MHTDAELSTKIYKFYRVSYYRKIRKGVRSQNPREVMKRNPFGDITIGMVWLVASIVILTFMMSPGAKTDDVAIVTQQLAMLVSLFSIYAFMRNHDGSSGGTVFVISIFAAFCVAILFFRTIQMREVVLEISSNLYPPSLTLLSHIQRMDMLMIPFNAIASALAFMSVGKWASMKKEPEET